MQMLKFLHNTSIIVGKGKEGVAAKKRQEAEAKKQSSLIDLSEKKNDLPEAGSGKNPEKRVIFPGTLWCGMGNKAENDEQLGTYADLDSCCRSHDKCDRKVEAFSKDYGYRNWRPFTVNDCDCDSEFYSCLKDAKEHKKAAKIVGKIFFNILSMPCLRFNAFGTKATKGHSPSFK
eukprot:gene3914-4456_t